MQEHVTLAFRRDQARHTVAAVRSLAADSRTEPQIRTVLNWCADELEQLAKPLVAALGSSAEDRLSRHEAVTSRKDPKRLVLQQVERIHSLLEAQYGKKAKELDGFFPFGRLTRLAAERFDHAVGTLSKKLAGAKLPFAKQEKTALDKAFAVYQKAAAAAGSAKGEFDADVQELRAAADAFDFAYRRADYLVRAALVDRPQDVASVILYPGKASKKQPKATPAVTPVAGAVG